MRILFFLILSFGITHAAIVIDPENGLRAIATRHYLERQIEQTAQNLISRQSSLQVREENGTTENTRRQSFMEVMRFITEGNSSQQPPSTHTENVPHEEKRTPSDVALHLLELETRRDIISAALRQAQEHEAAIKRIQDELEENDRLLIKSRVSRQSAERIDEIERRQDQLYVYLFLATGSLTSSRSHLQDNTKSLKRIYTAQTLIQKNLILQNRFFYLNKMDDFVLPPELSMPIHNFLPISLTDVLGNPLTEKKPPSSEPTSSDSLYETADEAATQNEFLQKKPV